MSTLHGSMAARMIMLAIAVLMQLPLWGEDIDSQSSAAKQDDKPVDAKTDAIRQMDFGKKSMLDSNTNPGRIVDAALAFAKALHYFDSVGDVDMICELQADIFWCKKRMSIDELKSYLSGKTADPSDAKVIAEADAAVVKTVAIAQAQEYFDNAAKYAQDHPDETAQIVSRYFEVAERFSGTDIGKKAQVLSIEAQKRMVIDAKAKHDALYETIFTRRSVPAGQREAMPNEDELHKAVVAIRKEFKDDFAVHRIGQDWRFSKTLAKMAMEDGVAPLRRYAMLEQAALLARDGKDYSAMITIANSMANSFVVDAKELMKPWLAHDRTNAEAAAILTLLDSPLDKNANLVVGKYFCFYEYHWDDGIPILAHGADGELTDWHQQGARLEALECSSRQVKLSRAGH